MKKVKAPDLSKVYNNILIIPDAHFPFENKDLFPFLTHLKETINPDLVINLGDIVDHAALSFHEKNPDMPGALDEYEACLEKLDRFYELFPQGLQVLGNHDIRALRVAQANGIPSIYLKPMEEVLRVPQGWILAERETFKTPTGEVLAVHSLGGNDMLNAQKLATSVVTGHKHTQFSLSYWSTKEKLMFALSAGCIIDPKHRAFNYSANRVLRPIIGAAAIIEGEPILIPMRLDKHGRWTGR